MTTVDEQLSAAGAKTNAQDLGRALAALVPHLHGDDCPVCGRDYREITDERLSAHVAQRVAELTETAQRCRHSRMRALKRAASSPDAKIAFASFPKQD